MAGLRSLTLLLIPALIGWAGASAEAAPAGWRGGARFAAPRAPFVVPAAWPRAGHGLRARPGSHRHVARQGGRRWMWGGWPDRDIFVEERPAPPQQPSARPDEVDRSAFANLPVRAGIPYPPRPEPVLYRLDGRGAGFSVRAETLPRSRGARLITLPPR